MAMIVMAPFVAREVAWLARRLGAAPVTALAAAALLVAAGLLWRKNLPKYSLNNPKTFPETFFQRMHGYSRSFPPGAADFINHYWGPAQTGLDLRGYAASSGPGSSWLSRIQMAMSQII